MDVVTGAAERFWAKVDRGGPDECWPWLKSRDKAGYGRYGVKAPYGWRAAAAQRVAWVLAHGLRELPPPDVFILHRCDNPPCCNPAHLFEGTLQDNHADMVNKGRHNRGEGVPQHKLSEEQIREVRTLYRPGSRWKPGVSQETLAGQSGVTQATIGRALRGESWAHVPS